MPHLLAFLFFSGLSLILFGDFLSAWQSAIPGGLQDTRLFLWNAWWFRHAMDVLNTNPFYTSLLFHPFGHTLISNDSPLWHSLTTYAAQAAGQNLAGASNVWFLTTWALNGFCAYLLAGEVLRTRTAADGWKLPAMLAGIYVMTHSYTLARAMQNWGQFNVYGIALFLWLMVRAHRLGRGRDFILAGIALAWTAACHYYFLIYSAAVWLAVWVLRIWPVRLQMPPGPPFSKEGFTGWRAFLLVLAFLAGAIAMLIIIRPGVWTLGGITVSMKTPANALLVMWLSIGAWVVGGLRLRLEWGTLDREVLRRRLTQGLILGGTALLCLSPLIIATLKLALEGGYPKQSILWKTHLPGANLLAPFMPNPMHSVWGQDVSAWLLARGIQPQEQAASIGWVCLAVILGAWHRNVGQVPIKWVALAVGATVMSMGTYLHVLQYNLWLPLPFYLWRLLPVFGNVRVAERWMALGAIAWGVALAMAVVWLARKRNWRPGVVCLAVGGALLLENWPGIPLGSLPPDNPVYRHLRELPRGGVLPLPLYIGDSSTGAGHAPGTLAWEILAAQTYHHQPLAGGYIGRVSREVIRRYEDDPFFGLLLNMEEGETQGARTVSTAEGCAAMKRFHIAYVLIYADAIDPAVRVYVKGSVPLEPIANTDTLELFRVDCPQPMVSTPL